MQNWTGRRVDLRDHAVAVALLMIGGEFDLPPGVMIGTCGLPARAMLITRYDLNVWPGDRSW